MRIFPITKEDFERLNEENGGICLACGALQDSGIEPDVEGYTCSECNEDKVCGIEQAVLLGQLAVKDQDDQDDEEELDEEDDELDEDDEFDLDDDDDDEADDDLDDDDDDDEDVVAKQGKLVR